MQEPRGDDDEDWVQEYQRWEEMQSAVKTLNALEQAIVDICDIGTVQAIQARKKVVLKK